MSMENRETQPALSVVIASWSGQEALTRCLESLLPQTGAAEVIVAFRGISDFAAQLGSHFPAVRFVRGPADASVFLLRSLGVHEAHGRLIVMLEDHSAVCAGWAEAILDAHSEGKLICGGPIENDIEGSAHDWALYFVEYGIYMPPIPAGEAAILSGVNIAYDREILLSCRAVWETLFYETDVNAALTRAGHKLHMLPKACVKSRLRMPFREAMHHLFTGGVHFGDFRKAKMSRLEQWLWLFVSPAVPLVLLVRIARLATTRQPARVIEIIRGLPYLLLLLAAWSAGEAASYARTTRPRPVTPKTEASEA
jgi:hypothetical protein